MKLHEVPYRTVVFSRPVPTRKADRCADPNPDIVRRGKSGQDGNGDAGNDRTLEEEGKARCDLSATKVVDPNRLPQTHAGNPAGKMNSLLVSINRNVSGNADPLTEVWVDNNSGADKNEPGLEQAGAVTAMVPAGIAVNADAATQSLAGCSPASGKSLPGDAYNEEVEAAESVRLSQGKAGVHVDSSLMRDQLSSKKEETSGVVKGLAGAVSDRIACSAEPYAGLYMIDEKVCRLRAVPMGDEASLPREGLNKERDTLQKRLKELQLLIENSMRLAKWLDEKPQTERNSLEPPTLEATFHEVSGDTYMEG